MMELATQIIISALLLLAATFALLYGLQYQHDIRRTKSKDEQPPPSYTFQ
jgi:hypothetical protein